MSVVYKLATDMKCQFEIEIDCGDCVACHQNFLCRAASNFVNPFTVGNPL